MNSNNSQPAPGAYDVIVVGGGAAGMFAAATAARTGARTLLLEKNAELGKKLAITGGGRCNVTNNKPDVRTMLAQYPEAGKFLFSAFTQFGVAEVKEWLAKRGVGLVEENEGRLFPDTHSAETIRGVLVKELQTCGVVVRTGVAVRSITRDTSTGDFVVHTRDGAERAPRCILAAGGTARPDTGSTGDGFIWAQSLGHTVAPNRNTLVPVMLAAPWTQTLSGLTLPDVEVSLWSEGKKQLRRRGRVLFTHWGLSGPLILNLSETIGDCLTAGPVTLTLDLFPELDAGALKEHLHQRLQSNQMLKNALAEDLPLQLVKGLLAELGIDGETPCHSVRSTERRRLRAALAELPLPVRGLLGPDKAVASAGGVDLREVDFRTMESKIVPGLYIIGDLLDINRPSGGYSLQMCWTSGYVAGVKAGARNPE